jgi:ribosomal protein S18 acetylase RimI-like enzyme
VEVEIRRIRADEGWRLRDVRLRALQDSPGAFSSTFEQDRIRPMSEWDDRARTGAADKRRAMSIAERAGPGGPFLGLAGGFEAEGRPDRVELISMWVDPAIRGAGIGAGLVRAVVEWARAGGARQVDLWVVTENDPAIALYRRCGFVTTSDRQPYPNRAGVDEARMALQVGDG